MKNEAFVLNLDSNGLGVIRSLGRNGIKVRGIDFRKNAVGFSSKYCKKSYVFTNPVNNKQELLNQIIDVAKHMHEKPVLIPTSDSYVIFISEYENELSEYFLFNIPGKKILNTIVNKDCQYKWASDIGIRVPHTLEITNENINYIIDSWNSFPAFIKGKKTSEWQEKYNIKGFKVNNKFELKEKSLEIISNGISIVIQEIIPGPNKNHYKVCAYYNKDRKLLCLFSTQKTRQFPVDFGVGSYMISVYSETIIKSAVKFFENINYTGVGSIEFKLSERDNQYYFIELNPRIWLQNIQAVYAGVNYALTNYLDCCGEHLKPVLTFKEGVRWLDAIQDFQSFLGNKRMGDVGFFEWLKSVFQSNCFANFAFDDLKPGLRNSDYLTKYVKFPLKIFSK